MIERPDVPSRHARAFEPQTLVEQITLSIQESIRKGTHSAGSQLPSGRILAINYGVSVTVIREALSRLKADGLVSSRQGKGVFVADNTTPRAFKLIEGSPPNAIRDIFELRLGVESYAASLAALRRTGRDLKHMAKCLKAMDPSVGDSDVALAADIEFHKAIATATQNPVIVSFMAFLQPHLRAAIGAARANSERHEDTRLISFEDHMRVYDAIVSADHEAAGKALKRLIRGGLQRLKISLDV